MTNQVTNTIDGILAGSKPAPWLPQPAQDARTFTFWAQIIFLLAALLWFLWGIISLVLGNIFGVLYIGFMLLSGIGGLFLKKYVIDEIDGGRFHEAKNNVIIWMIIGFVAFLIAGILLLIAYMKLNDALAPQTPGYTAYPQGTAVAQQPSQPYQQPQYQAQQPQQYPQYQQQAQAPAQPAPAQTYYQPPPAQPAHEQKYQMMKCKNCGVQFPAFMTNCPNCGSPK
jgi:uncharacterized protein with PQ loop repeat